MTDDLVVSPVTYFNCSMEAPAMFSLHTGSAAVYTARAPGKQTANEDTVALIPINQSSLVLAVADGMGGLPAGEDASRIVVKRLIKSLGRVNREGINVREAILNGIETANNEILESKSGAGTTLVVAEIQGNIMRTYHAGDSAILLTGNRGKLKYSAIAHSPTGYALEAGIINEKEAMMHEHRHLISNYIGIPDMRLEISQNLEISPRDTLLLASDGLSDNMYDNEVIEICRKGRLDRAARTLADTCIRYMVQPAANRGYHPDDLTFILFRPGTGN